MLTFHWKPILLPHRSDYIMVIRLRVALVIVSGVTLHVSIFYIVQHKTSIVLPDGRSRMEGTIKDVKVLGVDFGSSLASC